MNYLDIYTQNGLFRVIPVSKLNEFNRKKTQPQVKKLRGNREKIIKYTIKFDFIHFIVNQLDKSIHKMKRKHANHHINF